MPRGNKCSLPNGCWQSIRTTSCRRPASFQVLEAVVEQKGVAAEILDGVTAALDAVFVHQHHDVPEIGSEHVGFVAGRLGIEQEGFSVRDQAGRSAVLAQEQFVQKHLAEGLGFGTPAAGENGDGAALLLQFAGKFFDDGSFAGAAEGEVADGDDLDAESGIADQAGADGKAVNDEVELIQFGKAEQSGADQVGAQAAALVEDGLQERGLDGFDPGSNCLTHVEAQCANSPAAGQLLKRTNTKRKLARTGFMKQNCFMQVTLSKELEAFIAEKVQTGGYANADEVVRQALRDLKAKDEPAEVDSQEVAELLLAAVHRPHQPLTAEHFNQLRSRARGEVAA